MTLKVSACSGVRTFRTVRLYGFLPFLVLTGKQGLEFLYLAFVKPEPVLHPFHTYSI